VDGLGTLDKMLATNRPWCGGTTGSPPVTPTGHRAPCGSEMEAASRDAEKRPDPEVGALCLVCVSLGLGKSRRDHPNAGIIRRAFT